MGSDLLFKMGVLGPVLVTLLLGFTNGASIPECCKEKMVGGVSYVLKEETDTERYGCKSNCVFERVDSPGSKYCFKEGDLEVVCEDDDNGGGVFETDTCSSDQFPDIHAFKRKHVCDDCSNAVFAAVF